MRTSQARHDAPRHGATRKSVLGVRMPAWVTSAVTLLVALELAFGSLPTAALSTVALAAEDDAVEAQVEELVEETLGEVEAEAEAEDDSEEDSVTEADTEETTSETDEAVPSEEADEQDDEDAEETSSVDALPLADYVVKLFAANDSSSLQPPSVAKELKDNGDGTSTLSLSVKGSSAHSEETSGANVILVLDKTTSMALNMNTGQGSTASGITGYENNYLNSRFHAAKEATNILIDALDMETNDIELTVISFAASATTNVSKGTNPSSIKSTVRNITTTQSTNWEAALKAAYTALTNQDSDPTYIVFLTDGCPSTSDSASSHNHGSSGTTDRTDTCYTASVSQVKKIMGYRSDVYFYGIYCASATTNMLDYLVQDGGGTQFISATSESAINQAFSDIAKTITNDLSYGKVTINDSVTTDVTSTTLVSGTAGNFSYTVTDASGAVVGSWKDGETAYDNLPSATFKDGSVSWNLGDSYQLKDGYTYTVSFVVWPNQDAYDYVADLNNGVGTASWDDSKATAVYDSDGNLKYYKGGCSDYPSIVKYPNGTFGILTNDGQSVTYSVVTVDQDGNISYSDPTTVEMPSPEPLALTDTNLELEKKWDDNTDETQRPASVKLDLYKDDSVYLDDVELSAANNWKIDDGCAIAPGVMVGTGSPAYSTSYPQVTYEDATYAILEKGHDYYFQEDPQDYHFELTAYTYHPMVINGKLFNVTFSEDGTSIVSADEMTNISATNTLKGRLYVTKTVDVAEGAIGVDLAKTPFEITITLKDADGKAIEGQGTGEGKNGVMYRIQYGPNNPDRGEYDPAYDNYGRSGQKMFNGGTIAESIYAGDTIYVGNLPAGATYEVDEGTLPDGWTLDSITFGDESKKIAGNDEDQVTVKNTLPSQKVEIIKHDESDNALAGATFDLYGATSDGTIDTSNKILESLTSTSDGSVWVGTLSAGTYFLRETTAPAGYNRLADIKIVVTDKGVEATDATVSSKTVGDVTTYTITVKNVAGSKLPMSGGPGTTLLTITGACCVAAGALMLGSTPRRRREGRLS